MSFPEIERLAAKSQIILDELARLEPCSAEILASEVREMKIAYETSDFTVPASHSTSQFGTRVISNGRLGFVTTNADAETALKESAREAQNLARLSPPGEHHVIASRAQGGPSCHAALFDPLLAGLEADRVFALAQTLIGEARRDSRITVDRAELSIQTQYRTIINSDGVRHSSAQTIAWWFAMGMAKEGGEVTSFDYETGVVSHLSRMESEIASTMAKFRAGVLGSLGARRGESYKGLLLLTPEAVADLILSCVAYNCNGLRQQEGASSWKGKLGETVTSDLLSVSEDPADAERPEGWRPFDREGIPTARHDLLKAGRLSFVGHNCFSAHRGKTSPTGNASGGPRSVPGVGFANLSLTGTRTVPEVELFTRLGQGLVLKRFSGNRDDVSGNASGVAKNSTWVRGGARAHAVREAMVAGNLFDMMNRVVAVGSELHPVADGARVPYLLLDGASVTCA
ncbi:MAG: TldD/PmbA family protein [Planctomycetes bacterium]|nr:TldD/PmbA family protein [Planctomycetota bacterium]